MKLLSSILSVGMLLLALPLAAQEYRVEALNEPAPADSLSPEIAQKLSPTGMRIIKGEARTVADLWLAKEWPVKADFTPSNTVLYPFQGGELIGVARYKNKGGDFRDQEIPAGVYTLRYGQQPEDGNHIGTSDTRDFLLLIPAELDKTAKPMAQMEMFQLSPKTSGGTHPAMLSLLRADKRGSLPEVQHDEERELWSVVFSGNAMAGAKASPLVVELVVVGKAAE
jgi:hypothetical protein